MIWRDVWAVIRREYVQRVRSKWFIFATIGAPLFMVVLFVVPAYLAPTNGRVARDIVVVDATNALYERLAPELEEGGWNVRAVPWTSDVLAELWQQTEDGDIGGYVVLDDATLRTGEATFFVMSRPSSFRRLAMRGAITRAALEYGLQQSDVDAASLLGGGELRVEVLSGAGSDADEPRFAVAYGGAFLLYMVILLYAVAVMRATLEEKTSRIVEIVISSMKPWHLMLGKIVGVGAVGLTQMAVWIFSGVALAAAGLPALRTARPELTGLGELSDALPGPDLVALFIGLFLLGFFMYSSLYAAVGAMCSTDEEAQQAQLPLVMFQVVPILMVLPVIESPTTVMATGFSLFPLFSPILMWARIAGGGVPAWQVGLAFVLMALAGLGIASVAGRIYKAGILMTGKRPTLPELWRWVREA